MHGTWLDCLYMCVRVGAYNPCADEARRRRHVHVGRTRLGRGRLGVLNLGNFVKVLLDASQLREDGVVLGVDPVQTQ